MDRIEAYQIGTLIKEAMKSDKTFYTISEIELVNNMVRDFHPFVNDRDTVGAFKILFQEKILFYMFLVPWYLDNRYSLVVHTKNKEMLFGATEIQNNIIHWRYKPCKRDGCNEQRKRKFIEEYSEITAEIKKPMNVYEIDNFLSEIYKIAKAKIKADNI